MSQWNKPSLSKPWRANSSRNSPFRYLRWNA
jgi:hypothetical protein